MFAAGTRSRAAFAEKGTSCAGDVHPAWKPSPAHSRRCPAESVQ